MNILYTTNNTPLVQMDSGEIYAFNHQNVDILVGELSLDIEACYEIKNNLIDTINKTVNPINLTASSTFEEISTYIINVSVLGENHIINEIVDRSIKTYKMISTPKPHETWIWNFQLEEWVAPVPYPQLLVESDPDKYIWSDDKEAWVPAEPSPHKSWVWNPGTERYEPPIPYPLDAEPNEFKWDETRVMWVIND